MPWKSMNIRIFQIKIYWATFCVKLKESRNRPSVAQRVPGGLGSQISWHSAHEGGEVVSLTHRPPLPSGMFLVLIFTRGWVDPRAMIWLEGMSLKNPVTPPGIDPGTVRLVAQRLNQYATPGPTFCVGYLIMLSLLQTKQWGMYMIVEWWIGKDLEGSGYRQMEVLHPPKNCKVWQINHEGWDQ